MYGTIAEIRITSHTNPYINPHENAMIASRMTTDIATSPPHLVDATPRDPQPAGLRFKRALRLRVSHNSHDRLNPEVHPTSASRTNYRIANARSHVRNVFAMLTLANPLSRSPLRHNQPDDDEVDGASACSRSQYFVPPFTEAAVGSTIE